MRRLARAKKTRRKPRKPPLRSFPRRVDRSRISGYNEGMARFFNVSGRCRPDFNYMLPPLRRLPTVHELIENQAYFVLHAPRQVGKSTALFTLAQELTREGRYAAVLVSMEVGAGRPSDPDAAELAVLADWRADIRDQLPDELQPPPWPAAPSGQRISAALEAWTTACSRPLVVFLDEIDSLRDEMLISVLRQLRSGFGRRPRGFPWSLALCGMRDVRDYKIKSGGSERLTTASPFNIKDGSLTLRNFTHAEVAELYEQHTAETGQPFLPDAVARAFALTCGQPWLVNALARQITQVAVRDRSQPITTAHVDDAKDELILRRDTHLDSLAEKLHEERVRRVIEPILIGAEPQMDVMNDDLLYVRDLGMISELPNIRIANPIYQEIIPRTLSHVMQVSMVQEVAWYLRSDGSLDMILLLAAFQEFFAEHSEAWLSRFEYQEAGPHLLLMAFLQRVVNGGGRIHREFAVGSGRADLVVEYGGRRDVLELKLRQGPRTEADGIEQLGGYLTRLGESEGYLVLFDRRKGISWDEKLQLHEATGPGLRRIHVFAM